MYRQRKLLVDRLETSGKEYARYLAELPEEQIHAVPASNEWSIHQTAAHMRDTEQYVFLIRAQRILKEDHPVVQDFDQATWWRTHPYAPDEPLKQIIAEFRAARRKLARLLRQASAKDWNRLATHSAYGTISFDWLAMHCYHHTLEHIAQIGYLRENAVLKELNC